MSIQRTILAALAAAAASSPVFAQNAATLVLVSTYGNLHAGGVVATVTGDANANASAALEWRLAPGSFQPAHPLLRVAPSRFTGSLFGLQPGTAYEVRVTLTDPDGVAGSPQVAALTTRAEALPEPTLRTLYVSPGGNDGNPGTSPGAPLLTVQRAANLAQPGDLVLIQPGLYRETVTVPVSGTAAQPVVFRGNGPGAVLDGADTAVHAGVAWAAQGNGVFSCVLTFATGLVVTEQGRLYGYGSLVELGALAIGSPGGFFFDENTSTLYVKFPDLSSPAAHTMHVARHEQAFLLDGRSFVRFENLEIRHYGTSFGKGIYLRESSDTAVRSCRIHHIRQAPIWVRGGDRHRIEDNEIWDTALFGWPWSAVKGTPAEGSGIYFTMAVGRGSVVRRNRVRGYFNGIYPCGSAPPAGGVTNETDVYDNEVSEASDDAFEPEGHCANVRIFDNRIRDVLVPIAAAPASVGPTWVVRNVARYGDTPGGNVEGLHGSAVKLNSGFGDAVGPVLLYHNTFLEEAADANAMDFPSVGNGGLVRSRNNVYAGSRYAIEESTTVRQFQFDWDADDLFTTDATRFVKWLNVRYDDLPSLQAVNVELQGISAPPQLANPAAGVFRPLEGSALVDAGVVLTGINDGYLGTAPDIGAVETVPDDLIFADGLESGTLGAWSASSTDGGDLAATAAAALAGTAVGLRADVDDTAALFVEDQLPAAEPRYRARFYVDPNGFDPGESQAHRRTRLLIAFSEGPMRRLAAVVLRRLGGAYALLARARRDDNTQADTGFFAITDAPHLVEIELRSASGADALDGTLELWIDGVSRARLTGLDNSLGAVDLARLGALSVKGGAAGTMYLDEFESRRTSYIGPRP